MKFSKTKKPKVILEHLKGYQAIDAYPDGWSCVNCGNEYLPEEYEEKFYAIHTKHGTECTKCIYEI